MTEHVSFAQLQRLKPGSRREHEGLVEAVRLRCSLQGLEAIPIYTGGVPRFLPGGQLVLDRNPYQRGFADLLLPHLALCPHCGRPEPRVTFAEVKTGRARRSSIQVRSKTRLEALGFTCLLVRRQEDVDPIIEAHHHARRIACPHPRSR